MSDEGWTTVKKKNMKNSMTIEAENIKTSALTESEKEIISSGEYPRMLVESDFTLTSEEKERLVDDEFEYTTCMMSYMCEHGECMSCPFRKCTCCSARTLSKFLGRTVHPCYRCYCCIEDDDNDYEIWLESDTDVRYICKD